MTARSTPGADLMAPLWRALVAYRLVALLFAAGALVLRRDEITRLGAGVAVVGAMAAWTVVLTAAYGQGWGRTRRFAVLDVVVTIGAMLGSLTAEPWDAAAGGATLLTSIWVAGPVFAMALLHGRDGGLLTAGAIGVVVLSLRHPHGAGELSTVALLVTAGLVVGYAATVTRQSAARLHGAIAAEGAAVERERLARSIHDGVLQVLAAVQRRAAEPGGDMRDLAAAAKEQEIALRRLITPGQGTPDDTVRDLAVALRELARAHVEVVVPASTVRVPAGVADELVAAVKEALANVGRHAGDSARAWVVLDDLGDELEVVVRDDGPGIADGRLAAAESEGHLGVSRSIRGRVADLGGRAACHSTPGEGTEWEIRVPKEGPQ